MKYQPSKFRATLIVLLTALIIGCAVQETLQATSGSKADGVVALSYEYSEFEVPNYNIDQGLDVAKQRCAAWGYGGAEPFGGDTRQCTQRGVLRGCEHWFVTIKYQCIDVEKSRVVPPMVSATQPQQVPDVTPTISHGKRQAVGATFGADPDGLKVMTVAKYGPAARTGLSPGDLITKIDGKLCGPIYWEYAAQSITNATKDVTLTIRGKGDRVLSLASRATMANDTAPSDPALSPAPESGAFPGASSHVRLGVHCMQVSTPLAQTEHLPIGAAVRVETVEAGSVAEAAGIHVGDVLLKYGDRSLTEIGDLTAAIAATTQGAAISITVWRRTGESVVGVQF
jgi:hypothetical protein